MKFSIIVLVLAASLMVQEGDCFFFNRGFRLGLGIGMFNPLFNPFFPPFIPPVVFGKRAINDLKTSCSIMSNTEKLTCVGKETFTCDTMNMFEGIKLTAPYSIIIRDLTFVKDIHASELVFDILAQKEDPREFLNNTFVNPFDKTEVLFTIYGAKTIATHGFMIKDEACWTRFSTLIKETKPVNLDFEIVLQKELPEGEVIKVPETRDAVVMTNEEIKVAVKKELKDLTTKKVTL